MLLLVLQASPALAWSNGADGYNSYGTHDWILDRALDATNPEWVKRGVALRATDDPDSKDGLDHASSPWWHVYDRWGSEYGGADEAAAVWFNRVESRLANGKRKAASRALGILAHIVGDVANPTHTDSSKKEESMHSAHEAAVDRRIADFTFTYDGADSAKPAATVRRLARQAHKKYWKLVNAYSAHGYNGTVNRITKRQLNRAANAVADLITSLR